MARVKESTLISARHSESCVCYCHFDWLALGSVSDLKPRTGIGGRGSVHFSLDGKSTGNYGERVTVVTERFRARRISSPQTREE